MAEIVLFPTDPLPVETADETELNGHLTGDRFLLDEGLELLADFRMIQDKEVRASLRKLIKSMAAAARAGDARKD